jgi:hypothetical protein
MYPVLRVRCWCFFERTFFFILRNSPAILSFIFRSRTRKDRNGSLMTRNSPRLKLLNSSWARNRRSLCWWLHSQNKLQLTSLNHQLSYFKPTDLSEAFLASSSIIINNIVMCYLLPFRTFMFKYPFCVATMLLHFTVTKFTIKNDRLGT